MKIDIFKIIFSFISTLFIIFILSVLFIPIIYIKGDTLFSIIINNRELYFALLFSLGTSVISILLVTIVALPVAYVLARYDFWGKSFFDIILDIPIILPPLVTGLSLLILLGPVLGGYLNKIGLSFVFSPLGVIMAQFTIATPFAIRSFKTAFSEINPDLEKAAMTLGDPPFKVFRRITLPLARNGIIVGIAMAWARAVGEFGATVMLAGATRLKTETLPIAIFLNISVGDMEVAISISLIMIVFSIMVLAVLKRFERQGLKYRE